jgi:glycosyltransferase involved in cell wall biosynthesis
MLGQITPLVLTYNEVPNIARTLDRLRWASRVVVVDSFSTDGTLDIVRGYPNAVVLQRAFDDFANQLNHALAEAPIETPWVLTLDADYVLSELLVTELNGLCPPADVTGYLCSFRYCVDGVPLRGSLYPPAVVLFRRDLGRYANDGHAYRVRLAQGRVEDLRSPIDHDDRKSWSRWMASQRRYAAEEAQKLSASGWSELKWPDRLRKVPFASTLAVLPYCLVVKRCALDGRAGLVYTAQRSIAELMTTMQLMRRWKGRP